LNQSEKLKRVRKLQLTDFNRNSTMNFMLFALAEIHRVSQNQYSYRERIDWEKKKRIEMPKEISKRLVFNLEV